jgi:hypothetical protein
MLIVSCGCGDESWESWKRWGKREKENFFIFISSWFSKNKWSNQNFREMYIWRCTLWRQEVLSPWGTALGETPTVDSTDRWGQIPNVATHSGRSPSTVARSGRALAPWPRRQRRLI